MKAGLAGRFFAFPGQGSQTPGMGRALVSRFLVASETFDEASAALDLDVRDLLWNSSAATLTRTENAQPAILLHSIAAFRVWQSEHDGGLPDRPTADTAVPDTTLWAVGHSVGALAAAVAVGALDFGDAMTLARRRGELMASAPGRGGMLAVAVTSPDSVRAAMEVADTLGLDTACYNGERQLVFAGESERVAEAGRLLGSKSVPLEVSHAFHSRMMDPILPEWHRTVSGVRFTDPAVPYLSAGSDELCTTAEAIARDLSDGVRTPVQWQRVTGHAESAAAGYIFGNGSSLRRIWRRKPIEGRVEVVDDSFGKDTRRAA